MTLASDSHSNLQTRIADRAAVLKHSQEQALWRRTDRLFAGLLALQWLAGIVVALWLSPRAWNGLESYIHPHVWAAVFLGGAIAVGPVLLAIFRPGETLTRMVISAAQVSHSALLIHLSGGRIETHFHIFGSLAFLSFYRDWRVLVPATLVVALDHAWRGMFWPESVFGVLAASPWRWLEHAGWVIFEDIFLVWACVRGAKEIAILATRQAELEATNERVEAEVKRQTERLEAVTQELIGTARRAGMAEIATGVLHNVGNVLNSVNVSTSVAVKKLQNSEVGGLIKAGQMLREHRDDLSAFLTVDERGKHLPAFLIEVADCLGREQNNVLSELERVATGVEHIKQIVGAQQQHAKDKTILQKVVPAELFEQAISMNPEICSDANLRIVRQFEPIESVALDKHMVLQILVNLLSNAHKAVNGSGGGQKLITVAIRVVEDSGKKRIQFQVRDNGVGIAAENLARVFTHGFTTGQDGHGFGLHSAANAAREMGGNISVNSDGSGQGALFTLDLPLASLTAADQLLNREKGAAWQRN
jgi:signal transduction histidine kinase